MNKTEQKVGLGSDENGAVFKHEIDIVHMMWVVNLMNTEAENAEAALVCYGKDPADKSPVLECLWAVHQISSTLRVLGMKKAEFLTLEMERGLHQIYTDQLIGERHKLVMGGLMQAVKVLPAYFAHTQNVRRDTGRGLEPYVNNLRRWMGERPRPRAMFFYTDISLSPGLYRPSEDVSQEEAMAQAGEFLVVYLDMARRALRGKDVVEGMKNVARIAYRMQLIFIDRDPQHFWFAMIGLCEGIAGGLIVPDQCIARIFKTGAFLIKHTREHGLVVDKTVDYEECLQQMLYYIGSCISCPLHIQNIRKAFAVDKMKVEEATRALVHSDALMTALRAALDKLALSAEYLDSHNLTDLGVVEQPADVPDRTLRDYLEAARYRLEAAGQMGHVETLRQLDRSLDKLYRGGFRQNDHSVHAAIENLVRDVLEVKMDIEHKLEHGLGATYSTREFALREIVVRATFRQMSKVESYLQTILRRKALTRALARKPNDQESLRRLTLALHRYLNKSEQGHEGLRAAVRDADRGDPDLDLLYQLATQFLDQLQVMPDRKAIASSLQLLDEIAGAMAFAGLAREAALFVHCRDWLTAASHAGSVSEDEGLQAFANAFAYLELYLQRSIADPVGDNDALLENAESHALALETHAAGLSSGSDVARVASVGQAHEVQDQAINEDFREIFTEECEEISNELQQLHEAWSAEPQVGRHLREIRRHFHTLKGNGRAVGANVLGELGWAAQDLLDHVLDGDREIDERLCSLLTEVVSALPELVASYRAVEGPDEPAIRRLTNQCFLMTAHNEGLDRATSGWR